ncbi:MAG TPA: hypothetical protein VKP04_04800 [Ktedonobacteraceae bacterium]|nr:hypothetical protein [Ktedonobacteraceae bacterium]
MQMHKTPRPSVGTDYANAQNTPNICRGRFIVPTADLSALYGCSIILIILSMTITAPRGYASTPQAGANELPPSERIP